MSWLPWRSRTVIYSHRKARCQGKKDGRDWRWTVWPFRTEKPARPSADQKTAAFELELKEAAEGEIEGLLSDWQDEDRELLKEYCDARAEYRQARAAFERETEEATEARSDFEAREQELFSLDFPELDPRWMLFWLVLVGLGEFVFNAIVFELFGTEDWKTYVAALGIGIGIPFAGHYMGQALRQHTQSVRDWVLIGLTPVVVLGTLYALAYLRGKFAEATGRQLESFFGIEVTPGEFTWIFLLFNILLFFVAIICSYAGSHPEAALFRRRWKRYRAAKQDLEKESAESRQALARLESAEKRLQAARITRNSRFKQHRQTAIELDENTDWLSRAYRKANLDARREARVPPAFQEDPPSTQIELPPVFQQEELENWDCEGTDTTPRREPLAG